MNRDDNKQSTTLLPPAVEEALEEYVASCVEMDKANFHSTVETFEMHENKLRNSISNNFRQFYSIFNDGYSSIIEKLKNDNKFDDFLKMVDENSNEDTNNPNKLLYERFGFSPGVLELFYNAAYTFYHAKDFKKAKDAFYFLVSLAPNVQQFWLCLGQTYVELGQYTEAENTFLRAIDLDPTKADGYFPCINCFVKSNDLDKAKQLIEKGIEFAGNNKSEPWSGVLVNQLKETKEQLCQLK